MWEVRARRSHSCCGVGDAWCVGTTACDLHVATFALLRRCGRGRGGLVCAGWSRGTEACGIEDLNLFVVVAGFLARRGAVGSSLAGGRGPFFMCALGRSEFTGGGLAVTKPTFVMAVV